MSNPLWIKRLNKLKEKQGPKKGKFLTAVIFLLTPQPLLKQTRLFKMVVQLPMRGGRGSIREDTKGEKLSRFGLQASNEECICFEGICKI